MGGRKESETTRCMRQDRNVEGNGEAWERTGNSEDQGKIVQNRTMCGGKERGNREWRERQGIVRVTELQKRKLQEGDEG